MERYTKFVLLASTDYDILRDLARALALKGYPIAAALNWSEVEERLKSIPLSLIILDVKELDEMGRERIRRIHDAYPAVPLILISSLESDELAGALQEKTIAAYLVKPLSLSRLEGCLERLQVK